MLINASFDWVHIFCAVPTFGSKLFDIYVENNYIEVDPDPSNYVNTKSLITAEGIEPEKIARYFYDTQLEVNFCKNFNLSIGATERAMP
jgi:hypothetical protein